jgi:hypothetical protein
LWLLFSVKVVVFCAKWWMLNGFCWRRATPQYTHTSARTHTVWGHTADNYWLCLRMQVWILCSDDCATQDWLTTAHKTGWPPLTQPKTSRYPRIGIKRKEVTVTAYK